MSKLFNNGVESTVGLAGIVQRMKHQQHGSPVVRSEVATAAFSTESYTNVQSVQSQELQTAASTLRSMLGAAIGSSGVTMAQEEAGVFAGLMSGDPATFMTRKVPTYSDIKAQESANTIVIGSNAGVEKRVYSTEAFDNQVNNNVMTYSMVYNAQAARQNEFGEEFFRTVVMSPDQSGYIVNVQLIEVFDGLTRNISGAVDKFNFKNIVKAEIDPTVLRNDATRIYPVSRAESADMLLATLEKEIEVSGTKVKTAPLKIGKRFSLLGLSQTDAALKAGLQDETDAVDSNVILENLYVKLKDGDVVKFNTKNIPTSTFNQSIQGNARLLQLAFNTTTLHVSTATKKVDGAALTGASTIANYSIRLSAAAYGSINQQEGTTNISASPVSVEKITDADGNVISLTGTAGAAIVALFADASVIGYDLYAHRTNSNRRDRGQLVNNREMNYLYTVPVLPPITAQRPVYNNESNDPVLLNSLVATTRARASNAAVTAILEARDLLREYVHVSNAMGDSPEVFGVTRELVTPAYLEDTLDVSTMIDSLTSSDRAEDVSALLINKVRDFAYRLYQDSGYQAAADVMAGGKAQKPVVIIGTDPTIARYFTLTGDTRTLGDHFDFKVVATLDQRMKGSIVVSFRNGDDTVEGVPNVLSFGNMAWRPELTLMMPMVRNNSNVMEMTVHPSFRHVVNLPVMGWINVSGIKDIIAAKVAVKTKNG